MTSNSQNGRTRHSPCSSCCLLSRTRASESRGALLHTAAALSRRGRRVRPACLFRLEHCCTLVARRPHRPHSIAAAPPKAAPQSAILDMTLRADPASPCPGCMSSRSVGAPLRAVADSRRVAALAIALSSIFVHLSAGTTLATLAAGLSERSEGGGSGFQNAIEMLRLAMSLVSGWAIASALASVIGVLGVAWVRERRIGGEDAADGSDRTTCQRSGCSRYRPWPTRCAWASRSGPHTDRLAASGRSSSPASAWSSSIRRSSHALRPCSAKRSPRASWPASSPSAR